MLFIFCVFGLFHIQLDFDRFCGFGIMPIAFKNNVERLFLK